MSRMIKKEEYDHEVVVREQGNNASVMGEHEHIVERESGPALERQVVVEETPYSEHRQQITRNVGLERWQTYDKAAQIVWLLTGILEFLIGTRIILKLLAANPNAGFAQFVYTITAPFLVPFTGLVGQPAANGSVFELSSLIAMIIYAFLAWLVTRLLRLILDTERTTTIRTYHREEL